MLISIQFLIHSDFVTDANRQDIARNSPRNEHILKATGKAFVKAVLKFCEHPTLRYQWMRYLPSRYSHAQDRVWTTLVETIHSCLQKTPVLWTRSHKELRLIKDMRRLTQDLLDKYKSPLYPDLAPEEYLPPDYLVKDLNLLTDYGLCWLDMDGFLTRVRKDLGKRESSIMMSPDTDNDWHSRVAKTLFNAWHNKAKEMERLALIPTRNGTWKSASNASSKEIYYPYVNGYEIPGNLKLRLLDPKAQENCDRKQLFDRLGVQKAQLSDIRRVVVSHNSERDVMLLSNRIHLEFLYRTAHLDKNNDHSLFYSTIKFFDHMERKRVQGGTVYFPSEDPYGAQRLFRPAPINGVHSTPHLGVPFLNDYYMSRPPAQPDKEARTWRTWLSEMFYIRDMIPLTNAENLSEECRYVAEYRPAEFLGFLLRYWKPEESKITRNRALSRELLNVKVLCKKNTFHPLGETYVYGKDLEYADRFIIEGEFFPWLEHEASSCYNSGLPDLEILTSALEFGYPKSELEFYLTILQFVKTANEDANKLADVDRVYELYSRIKSRCHESGNSSISRQTIL